MKLQTILLVLAAMWGLSSGACAEGLADCEGGVQTLHPLVMPGEQVAAAYALDAQRLQWPAQQLASAERVRLYLSSRAQLRWQVGEPVSGADERLELAQSRAPLPAALRERWRFVAPGLQLRLPPMDALAWARVFQAQSLLVREDAQGRVLAATAVQWPGALDAVYASADDRRLLGVAPEARRTRFRVWAPTAQALSVCVFANADGPASRRLPLQREPSTGAWQLSHPEDLSGHYYVYLAELFAPGQGVVRVSVTDPYSISLNADSRRSYVGRLDAQALKPSGWDASQAPDTVRRNVDLAIYELHLRDFSISDPTVPTADRGKYLAFTHPQSAGMQHLASLAQSGLTDVHLLPVFDFASVPERGCVSPAVPDDGPAGKGQRDAVQAVAAQDCFNWGYDPWHYGAPEGSYASDANAAERRIIEFRRMVMGLHAIGLRVGMDLVYNHTAAAGLQPASVLDKLVPGYYQRLDAQGHIERSTCCDNTATEHRMMARLLRDTVLRWQRDYKISSFRFDLMGHQPRALMERLQRELKATAGRHIPLIGEGWNFGEIADGARFVQASQRSLGGSGIASFSDRGRDAWRGGGAADHGADLVLRQGLLNGLVDAPNELVDEQGLDRSPERARTRAQALALSRLALAGTLARVRVPDAQGRLRRGDQLDYAGQGAGYAEAPGETVNYVENHDNQTLYDINALRLPRGADAQARVQAQVLGLALTALSQGVAYFHAGIDLMRSKSLDRNSYDSGDWFNRIDWSAQSHAFGRGLPPVADNGSDEAWLSPALNEPRLRMPPEALQQVRDGLRRYLAIRASSSLFHLQSADEIAARLRFPSVPPEQADALIAVHLDGHGLAGSGASALLLLFNFSARELSWSWPDARRQSWTLHPALRSGVSLALAGAPFDAGAFRVPGRTALVFRLD